MRAAGQLQTIRAEDVAVMGITEIIRHIPRIYRSYRRLVRSIRTSRPDLAVLIDFPDVNFRLARHLHRAGVPVLWLVSPQLWAWKRRRLRWMQRRVNRIFVIFPFEQTFYTARGVHAEFIGHPLASLPPPQISRQAYADAATAIAQDQWLYTGDSSGPSLKGVFWPQEKGTIRPPLDPEKQWISLLPGSRFSEIKSNLPTLVEAAYQLGSHYEFIIPIAPTITESQLDRILYETGDLYLAKPNPPRITFVRDARAALHHSRAAAVASGTATVQAVLIGTPFVVVYRVSSLTYALARQLIRYPEEIPATRDTYGNLPIAMPNLIAGRRLVPELLNRQFTPEAVAAHLLQLADDTPAREAQITGLAQLRHDLQSPAGAPDPISAVATHILHLLQPESR